MGTGDRNKVNPVGANRTAQPKASYPSRPATASQRTPASTGAKFGGAAAGGVSKAEY